MFKVRHKVSNSIHEVYDIQYDPITGYPQFLLYENGDWVKVSGKHYEPNIDKKKKLYESNHKDKEYKFEDDM